jgi:hypothetical protein
MGVRAHVRPRLSRPRYGASPLHLLGHLGVLGIAAYVFGSLLAPSAGVLVWFVGGALLHDFVLLPLYSLLDRLGRTVARGPALNHLRVPVVISGLLLLVFFPLILTRAPGSYESSTGHPPEGYAVRWLAITLALFAGSGVLYLWRRRRRT